MAVPAAAVDRQVVVQGSVVVEARAAPNPPADPNRCVAAAFLQFPDVPGATNYAARVADSILMFQDVHGPPFNDTYQEFTGLQTLVWTAPAGTHRLFLSSGSTGMGCAAALAGFAGRFPAQVDVTATVPVANVSVKGTLEERRCDEKGCQRVPVPRTTVTATGSAVGVAVSDDKGQYTLSLPTGTYDITPTQTTGDPLWDPPKRTVAVSQDTTGVDFLRCSGGAPPARAPTQKERPCAVPTPPRRSAR